MGDVADRAGEEGEVLAQAKEEQRRRDMEVMNTPSGVTECEECEVDITARVAKVPAAKLCVSCQEVEDSVSRHFSQ